MGWEGELHDQQWCSAEIKGDTEADEAAGGDEHAGILRGGLDRDADKEKQGGENERRLAAERVADVGGERETEKLPYVLDCVQAEGTPWSVGSGILDLGC